MERWDKIQELFRQAIELPPDERMRFLDQACGEDDSLREEVEQLLVSDDRVGDYLEAAVQAGAELFIDQPAITMIGQRIGPYEIKANLGQGGMSTVHLAVRVDEHFQKRVAIKLIKRGMDTEEILTRFRQERQILASLDHPHIARLFDGGATDDGLPYFVMEYIEGVPIDEYCDSHKLSTVERLTLFQSVCSAVHYAHQNLIVHRDLKPSNILITSEGVPKLLDFGIAKLLNPDLSSRTISPTVVGSRFMTPEYASPEQVRGQAVTTASDVYSLGVLLYELLTGHRPYRFESRSPQEVERVICSIDPEKPSTIISRIEELPASDGQTRVKLTPESVSRTRDGQPEKLRRRLVGDLDNILLMAMRKEPSRRYGSVEQFSEDIRRYLEQRPILARKDTLTYRTGKFIRRNKVAVSVGAAFLILTIGFVVSVIVQSARTATERQKAEQVSAFLVNLFSVVDPNQARAGTITARELLDKGVEKATNELKSQPDVQATLLDTLGRGYQKLGFYDRATPLLERALSLRQQVFGDDHPDVIASINNLAELLQDKGLYEEAEKLYDQALDLIRRQHGADHPDIATGLDHLADVAADKGDYAAAESLYRQALELRRKQFGDDHADVATSLNNLAFLLHGKGDYNGAEQLYQQALALQRKVLGPEHPDVAESLDSLAFLEHEKGDYEAAERLYRESLALRRKALGDEHTDVAASLNSLALVLVDKGEPEAAESILREALALTRQRLGEEHPEVAYSLSTLAGLFHDQGNLPAAEDLYRQAIALMEKRLGKEHPDLAVMLDSLAGVLQDRRAYAEAERIYRRSLGLTRKRLGPTHPDIAYALNGLALLYHEKRDYAAAEPLYRQALALARERLGETHPIALTCSSNLAGLLADRRQYTEAESLFHQIIERQRQIYPEGHLETAFPLIGLGRLLTEKGDPRAAEPLLREGWEIWRQTRPKDHWRTADAASALGGCLIALHEYREAEPLLTESYPILKSALGIQHRRTQEVLKRLIALYQASGQPQKAAQYRGLLSPSQSRN